METVFLGDGRTGFKKWSVAHPPASNDDDPADGGRPVAVRPRATVVESVEQAHRPWLTQGVGNVL